MRTVERDFRRFFGAIFNSLPQDPHSEGYLDVESQEFDNHWPKMKPRHSDALCMLKKVILSCSLETFIALLSFLRVILYLVGSIENEHAFPGFKESF